MGFESGASQWQRFCMQGDAAPGIASCSGSWQNASEASCHAHQPDSLTQGMGALLGSPWLRVRKATSPSEADIPCSAASIAKMTGTCDRAARKCVQVLARLGRHGRSHSGPRGEAVYIPRCLQSSDIFLPRLRHTRLPRK